MATTFDALEFDFSEFIVPDVGILVRSPRNQKIRNSTISAFTQDLTAGGSSTGGPGEIASVSVLSPISIRATFAAPVKDNLALHNPDNYQITPALTVYSVTPESAVNPSYVDLEIDEQQTGVSYDIEIVAIEEA